MTRDDQADSDVDARLDALEREVANLQNTVDTVTGRHLPLLTATLRALTAADIDTIEDLPAAGTQHYREIEELAAAVDALEQRVAALGDVGTAKTSKEQKYAAVVAFAQNKGGTQQSKVAVTAPEIKGCVGVSGRYAYDLIDAMAGDVDGVRLREATRVETPTGVKRKQKALLVDCEAVQTSGGRVNAFTTGGGESGSG